MSSCSCGTEKKDGDCKCCPCRFILTQLKFPRAAFWLALASIVALGMAFTAEYGFKLEPCRLCYIERVPLYLTLLFMLVAWIKRGNEKIVTLMLSLAGMVMLVNAGIAFYHVGVEQHWWEEAVVGCSIIPLPDASDTSVTAASVRAALLDTKVVPCDVVTWTVLGISIATWNVPFSLGLGLFALMAATVIRKKIELKDGECCCRKKACDCGPDCKCGCQEGKPCTCDKK